MAAGNPLATIAPQIRVGRMLLKCSVTSASQAGSSGTNASAGRWFKFVKRFLAPS